VPVSGLGTTTRWLRERRGTTPLAARAHGRSLKRLWRAYPFGSTEPVLAKPGRRFFRRLPGDGRIDAAESYRETV